MWKAASKGVARWGSELNVQIKHEIEAYWKDYVTKTKNGLLTRNEKYYVLSMFPYPSGNLHMGHVRVYSISDSVARFQRMNGYKVIHPMGWDSFGLPAENAAIDRNLAPSKWTTENISKMKEQLYDLGCNFDWEHEINTCDPSYYRWTQAMFLELYKAGLIYKKEASVNWDPIDQTVLADEQVDLNGCSWRSGAKVEKKLLNQWFVKTTRFGQELYDGLNDPSLIDWKDITQMQKHWIGKCNGISIDLSLLYTQPTGESLKSLTAWTDKPETLLHCKFIAIPTSHILNNDKLVSFESKHYKRLTVFAENPITNQKLPIYVTSSINFPEGVEAHIGSPEISEEDQQFGLLSGISIDGDMTIARSEQEIQNMRNQVCEKAKQLNVGGYPVSSKLKDWLISRQRYWGTPIPIVNCKSCGLQPVPMEQLPVLLPDIDVKNSKTGQSPLVNATEWLKTECPKCGEEATRETDTMDTFVDSSWYFLRYLDSQNTSEAFSKSKSWSNLPVDVYIGGKEHAVLHLYYARFMTHFLHSINKVPMKEPFKRLLVQGVVFGKTFKVKETGKYIPENEVKVIDEDKGQAFTLDYGLPVEIGWEKMSKSKFNGVDPATLFQEYSCDTTRLFMLADVTPVSPRRWCNDTFPGIINWEYKFWNIVMKFINLRTDPESFHDKESLLDSVEFKVNENNLWNSRNYFTTQTTFHYNYTNHLSIAISKLQGATKTLLKVPKMYIPISSEYERLLGSQIVMLAPIAPHFASELWAGFISAENRVNAEDFMFDWNKNVLDQKWPVVDSHCNLELVCLVNNTVICSISLLRDDMNRLKINEALALVSQDKKVMKKLKTEIDNVDFKVYENCRAYINIKTKHVKKPMIENEVSAETA